MMASVLVSPLFAISCTGVDLHTKKMVLVAKMRDEHLRAVFTMDVSVYRPEMLVFLDETGADRRNAMRQYGYSIRGKPARSHKILSVQGLLDCKVVQGSLDGDEFYDFVNSHLIEHQSHAAGMLIFSAMLLFQIRVNAINLVFFLLAFRWDGVVMLPFLRTSPRLLKSEWTSLHHTTE